MSEEEKIDKYITNLTNILQKLTERVDAIEIDSLKNTVRYNSYKQNNDRFIENVLEGPILVLRHTLQNHQNQLQTVEDKINDIYQLMESQKLAIQKEIESLKRQTGEFRKLHKSEQDSRAVSQYSINSTIAQLKKVVNNENSVQRTEIQNLKDRLLKQHKQLNSKNEQSVRSVHLLARQHTELQKKLDQFITSNKNMVDLQTTIKDLVIEQVAIIKKEQIILQTKPTVQEPKIIMFENQTTQTDDNNNTQQQSIRIELQNQQKGFSLLYDNLQKDINNINLIVANISDRLRAQFKIGEIADRITALEKRVNQELSMDHQITIINSEPKLKSDNFSFSNLTSIYSGNELNIQLRQNKDFIVKYSKQTNKRLQVLQHNVTQLVSQMDLKAPIQQTVRLQESKCTKFAFSELTKTLEHFKMLLMKQLPELNCKNIKFGPENKAQSSRLYSTIRINIDERHENKNYESEKRLIYYPMLTRPKKQKIALFNRGLNTTLNKQSRTQTIDIMETR